MPSWRKWRDRRKAVATPVTDSTDSQKPRLVGQGERSYTFVGAAPEQLDKDSTASDVIAEVVPAEATSDVDAGLVNQAAPLQKDEIRVLDLQPSLKEDSMIVCQRCRINIGRDNRLDYPDTHWMNWTYGGGLKPSLAYITLSCTWGETQADGSHLSHTILCDNESVRITSNLDAALRRIRTLVREKQLPECPVWIDALCIRQDDFEERNAQVQQMDRIYQHSDRVVIWLGEPDGDPNEDDNLRYFVYVCQVYFEADELDPESWQRRKLLGYKCPIDDADRAAVSFLLHRPWFTRRWVIQEAYHKAPRHRLVCTGKFAIAGDRFERALWEMNLLDRAPALVRAEPQRDSILQNLQVYHDVECADPRDRIYALVSVSKERRDLSIDYGISTRELYHSFARERISIALLVAAASRGAKRIGTLESLPSWVPDWRVEAHYRSGSHRGHVLEALALTKSPDILRLDSIGSGLLSVEARLLKPCAHAQSCQDFRCRCGACIFSRAASRSRHGLQVVAGLSTVSRRRLMLIDECPVGFWVEPIDLWNASSSFKGRGLQLRSCVALPELAAHTTRFRLFEDVGSQTVYIC